MKANTRPTLEKVDLIFNMSSFVRNSAGAVGKKAWEHKIITAVVLLGLYASHRTYGIYRSFKDSFGGLTGLDDDALGELLDDPEDKNKTANKTKSIENPSQSVKMFKEFLREDELNLL